jgi:hypothetical protein
MSNCFGTYNNQTSSDYLTKKRNITIYRDLETNTNNKGKSIAGVNSGGYLYRVNNHMNKLSLMRGFVDCSGTTITKNEQEFNYACKGSSSFTNNNDISNAYTGTILTYSSLTDVGLDTQFTNNKKYAEIADGSLVGISGNNKTRTIKCYSNNMKVNVSTS